MAKKAKGKRGKAGKALKPKDLSARSGAASVKGGVIAPCDLRTRHK